MTREKFRSGKSGGSKRNGPEQAHGRTLSSLVSSCPSAFSSLKISAPSKQLTEIDSLPQAFREAQSLRLSGNNLVSLGDIAQFTKLSSLSLASNLISSIEALRPLQNCKRLKVLVLEGNPVTRLPFYRARVLGLLRGLKTLDHQVVSEEERQQHDNALHVHRGIMRTLFYNDCRIWVLTAVLRRLKLHISLRQRLLLQHPSYAHASLNEPQPFDIALAIRLWDYEQGLSDMERTAAQTRIDDSAARAWNVLRLQAMKKSQSKYTSADDTKLWEQAFAQLAVVQQEAIATLLSKCEQLRDKDLVYQKMLWNRDPKGLLRRLHRDNADAQVRREAEDRKVAKDLVQTIDGLLWHDENGGLAPAARRPGGVARAAKPQGRRDLNGNTSKRPLASKGAKPGPRTAGQRRKTVSFSEQRRSRSPPNKRAQPPARLPSMVSVQVSPFMRVLGVEDKAEETRQQKEGDDRALEGVVPSSKPSPRPAASPQFLAAERPRTVRPPPHSMPQEEFSEETPLLLAASHPLPMDQREASVEEGDQPYPVAPFVDFSAVATSDVGALRQQVEALQAHVNMRVEVEKKLQAINCAMRDRLEEYRRQNTVNLEEYEKRTSNLRMQLDEALKEQSNTFDRYLRMEQQVKELSKSVKDGEAKAAQLEELQAQFKVLEEDYGKAKKRCRTVQAQLHSVEQFSEELERESQREKTQRMALERQLEEYLREQANAEAAKAFRTEVLLRRSLRSWCWALPTLRKEKRGALSLLLIHGKLQQRRFFNLWQQSLAIAEFHGRVAYALDKRRMAAAWACLRHELRIRRFRQRSSANRRKETYWRCWVAWKRHCGAVYHMRQCWRLKVAEMAFQSWSRILQWYELQPPQVYIAQKAADTCYRNTLTNKVFNAWRRHYRNGIVAEQHYRETLQSRCFQAWSFFKAVRERKRRVDVVVSRKYCAARQRRAYHVWRESVQRRLALRALHHRANCNLLREVMFQWGRWLQQTRLQRFKVSSMQRKRHVKVLRRHLWHWSVAIQERIHQRRSQEAAAAHCRGVLGKSALQRWQKALAVAKGQRWAVRLFQAVALRSAFHGLVSSVQRETARQQQLAACRMLRGVEDCLEQRFAFRQWVAVTSRKRAQAIAVHRCLTRVHRLRCRSAWGCWLRYLWRTQHEEAVEAQQLVRSLRARKEVAEESVHELSLHNERLVERIQELTKQLSELKVAFQESHEEVKQASVALAEAAETDSHRQSDLLKANSTIEALRQQVMRLNEEVIRKEEAVNSAQGTSALVEAKTQRRVETLERKLEDSTRRAHDLEWQLKEAKAEIKRYQAKEEEHHKTSSSLQRYQTDCDYLEEQLAQAEARASESVSTVRKLRQELWEQEQAYRSQIRELELANRRLCCESEEDIDATGQLSQLAATNSGEWITPTRVAPGPLRTVEADASAGKHALFAKTVLRTASERRATSRSGVEGEASQKLRSRIGELLNVDDIQSIASEARQEIERLEGKLKSSREL